MYYIIRHKSICGHSDIITIAIFNMISLLVPFIQVLDLPCIVFAVPVCWTEKKIETELNPTAKDQTTSCGCTNSKIFQLPVARFVEKNWSGPVATGLSSHHVLDLIHTHTYLIFSLWIIKNGGRLVEIWLKIFLYATQMYVPSVSAISQPNLNQIAWNLDQSTENQNTYLCNQCMWGNIGFIWYNKFYNNRLVATSLDRFFSHCGPTQTGL